MYPGFPDFHAGGIVVGRDDVVQAIGLGDIGAGQGATPAIVLCNDFALTIIGIGICGSISISSDAINGSVTIKSIATVATVSLGPCVTELGI